MIRIHQLKTRCAADVPFEGDALKQYIIRKAEKLLNCGKGQKIRIRNLNIVRHSVDARKKPELYHVYEVNVETGISPQEEIQLVKRLKNPSIEVIRETRYSEPQHGTQDLRYRPVVIGAGPAGLFCSLMLARHGYKPVLLERGRAMDERTRDVENFWATGVLNSESNCQFGEGGAGTFSDGKLNTLINDKTGRSEKVLKIFCEAGAPDDILYEGKPHIGTDELKKVIVNIREEIINAGGEVRFEAKAEKLVIREGRVRGVLMRDGTVIDTDILVLAPGHSARDTIRQLYEQQIPMCSKPLAVGFRVSHPQQLINYSQYGIADPEELKRIGLSAASYKLTARAGSGRGVYSFCMCPGGYVVNASSEPGRTCVNGMSNHDRGSDRANSAIVMTVGEQEYGSDHPLAGMSFQEKLEERCYKLGKGKIPAETYSDFKQRRSDPAGQSLPAKLCVRGLYTPAPLHGLLPEELTADFVEGMEAFERKIHGFAGEEACVLGLESRTSSPVRILRNENGESPIPGLYPCGEGAGYAGGIMSAAMDGIRIAEQLIRTYAPLNNTEDKI